MSKYTPSPAVRNLDQLLQEAMEKREAEEKNKQEDDEEDLDYLDSVIKTEIDAMRKKLRTLITERNKFAKERANTYESLSKTKKAIRELESKKDRLAFKYGQVNQSFNVRNLKINSLRLEIQRLQSALNAEPPLSQCNAEIDDDVVEVPAPSTNIQEIMDEEDQKRFEETLRLAKETGDEAKIAFFHYKKRSGLDAKRLREIDDVLSKNSKKRKEEEEVVEEILTD